MYNMRLKSGQWPQRFITGNAGNMNVGGTAQPFEQWPCLIATASINKIVIMWCWVSGIDLNELTMN